MKYIILLSLIANWSMAQSGTVYETYKTTGGGTNQSRGTIFTQPFESKDINATGIKYNIKAQAVSQNPIKKDNGPTYDGETYSSGDGE
jgi:hypothetical protein